MTAVLDEDREAFRRDGMQLVAALLTYLNAPDDALTRQAAERAAEGVTDDLADRLAQTRLGLGEAVAMFVAARRPFFDEIGQLARRRALDPAALAGLYDGASRMLDRLLLRFIATHQANSPGADSTNEQGARP